MNDLIKKIQRDYYIINISYMISLSIFGAVFYLYLQHQGFSFLEINLFSSVFWIGNFFTELPAGVVADKYGRKISMQISVIIRSLGLFLLLLSPNIFILLISALLTSIGESFKSGTLESWAIDQINKFDSNFDSTNFFSKDKLYINGISLIVTFLGAQVLAQIDLRIPFILAPILLLVNGIIVCVLMKDNRLGNPKEQDDEMSPNLLSDLKTGFSYLYNHHYFLNLVLAMLPIQIVLSGPSSQWQLFFSEKSELLITGYISILIRLSAMLGQYLTPKLSSYFKCKTNYFILTTTINGLAIIYTALSSSIIVALLFFSFHVIAMSSEQVSRYALLHNEIKAENRATILSTFNTIESGFTVLCFLLIGFLSNCFSLSVSWIISSILMMLLAIPMFIHLSKIKRSELIAQ